MAQRTSYQMTLLAKFNRFQPTGEQEEQLLAVVGNMPVTKVDQLARQAKTLADVIGKANSEERKSKQDEERRKAREHAEAWAAAMNCTYDDLVNLTGPYYDAVRAARMDSTQDGEGK